MLPVATLTSVTATGDVVVGPGAPTIIFNGMPVSCLGDSVDGAACVGAISETLSVTCIMDGRPVATLTSVVAGANPETGVPVATTIVETVAVTELR